MTCDCLRAFLLLVFISISAGRPINDPKQLVRDLLEQWKEEDVIKIPVVGVEDPYPMERFEAGGASFEGNMISGLTNIHLVSVLVHQNEEDIFEAQAEVLIPKLVVTGDFRYGGGWWGDIVGKYTATLSGIVAIGGAVPIIDENGMVQLARIEPDVSYDDMTIDVDSDSYVVGFLSTLINSLNSIIFSFIKPTLVEIINDKGIPAVNQELAEKMTIRFPNSISMIDSLIANERTARLPSSMELEDIQVGGSMSVNFHNGYVQGLRTIHRSGPVQFMLRNHTFHVLINLGVGSLKGGYDWTIPLWLMEYQGQIDFELEGLTVLLDISQSANIEKQPSVHELSISVDAVALALDGTSYGDYLLEFFINVIPNLFKQSFYSAAQLPLTAIANQIAQSITPQDIVDQHL